MDSEERMAIILAGGEWGRGSKSPARRSAERGVPKQFCRLSGGPTVLERTYRRVALTFPPERTMTVVTRTHRKFYEDLLPDVSPARLLIQPRNRGTAPATLYALSRARRIAPGAGVAIFPSHHCVGDDAAFMRHVELAFEGIRARPDLLVLLGTTPDGPEVDYCWIELGDRINEYLRLFQIRGFWENPSHKLAMRLWQSGCLWNSSVVVAQIPVILSLMRRVLPELAMSFDSVSSMIGTEREGEAVEKVYTDVSEQDFSHELSVGSPDNLAVLPIAGVEWSDLQKPRRARSALRRAGVRPKWLDATAPRSRR
jgi:mannose-1-phosphate guanylyltransferase